MIWIYSLSFSLCLSGEVIIGVCVCVGETEVTPGSMHERGLHSELNIHWSMTATENIHLTPKCVNVRGWKVSALY